MQVYPFLLFNGNCRDAMEFYRSCLGGKLQLQSIQETIQQPLMPEMMQQKIVMATLEYSGGLLTASDLCPDDFQHNNANMQLLMNCSSKTELYTLYSLLTENALAETSPVTNEAGAMQAYISDAYGIQWLLHFQE